MKIQPRIGVLGLALALLVLPGCERGGQEETGAQTESEQGAQPSGPAKAPETSVAEEAAGEPAEKPAEEGADRMAAAETDSSADGGAGETSLSGEDAANNLGCTACHAAETQLVGPPYNAVAERYGGDKAKILEVTKSAVNNGASGKWTDVTGGTPMPPQPQASGQEKQLEAIAEWIAGLAG